MQFCHKAISSRSRYAAVASHRCWARAGHISPCEEYPYLRHLREVAPKVADKIKRDATNTTGAAWDSEGAGPNRILRWAVMLDDKDLLEYGPDLSGLSDVIRRKLRQRAASYEDCMSVAQSLTHGTYRMLDAPEPPEDVLTYLEDILGVIEPASAACIICLEPLSFNLFALAKRGAAALDTAHRDPRSHMPGNVGFAHHRCNVAQGDKTVDEFYDWIVEILKRAGRLDS